MNRGYNMNERERDTIRKCERKNVVEATTQPASMSIDLSMMAPLAELLQRVIDSLGR